MTTPLNIRAAELLEEHAKYLWTIGTTSEGKWNDEDAHDRETHATHDELIEVARQLRQKEKDGITFAKNMSQALNSGDGSYRP